MASFPKALFDALAENQKEKDNKYLVIRWSDDNSFEIIAQKDIQGASNSIELSQEQLFTINGKQRQGTAIGKGSRKECKNLYCDALSKAMKAQAKGKSSSSKASTEGVNDENDDDKISEEIQKAVLNKVLELMIKGKNDHNAGDANSSHVHNVTCDACESTRIRDDRYKCLQCDDFNLCAGCFERRPEGKKHKSGHLMAHYRLPNELFGRSVSDDDVTLEKLKQFYSKETNESTNCDGCKENGFVGLRFKCDSCPDYDLCEKCATTGVTTNDHKSSHPLILTSRRVIVQIPVSDIELCEKLGSGAFGSVHKARWKPKDLIVACKIIQVPSTEEAETLEKSFFKELAAYMELSGGYILKTYGYALARQKNTKLYMIISEFMERGSLASVLKDKGKLCLHRKVHMARQIISGIRKIHEHHMIHRDIRSDNVMVNKNYVCKIGDMGIARVVDPFNQHTKIGCQSFMPPEFYSGTYDQKLDIFTFGLTLNELFTETKHAFRPNVKERIAFRTESPIFKDLITRCTADDPKLRPAAIEVEKTLELYCQGFETIVVKENIGYIRLNTEQKNAVYMQFYEQFNKPATEFIRKQFPPQFLEGPTTIRGVKVQENNADEEGQIVCRLQ